MKPRVSIIIPIHDGLYRLRDTLDSVLAQTYDNIEIIVVDSEYNGNGASEQIPKTYSDKIKFYNKLNSSLFEAINYGVKKSTGQYFSWLSQGDTYKPDRVEQMIKLATKLSNEVIVSSWSTVNENGRVTHTHAIDPRVGQYPDCYMAFGIETRLNTCAMLIPTELFKSSGLFDGALPPFQNYDMIRRLVAAGASFKTCSQVLFSYGSHSMQESLAGVMSEHGYDYLHSEAIVDLSYDDIINYFGGKSNTFAYYRQILDAGFPRTAAFLMEKIIHGLIVHESHEVAATALLDELSRLPEDQMATSSDVLISKSAKPTSKKKILFSSAHWLTGGMERVMSVLFRELKNDYEVFLITPYDSRKSYIDVPDFVTNIKIDNELFKRHFDSVILSYALLLDIDVVIGFINLFDKQQNLYNLCVGTKIKTIASNHEYYFYPYKSPAHYDVVEKRLNAYKNCSAILWANNFNAALCNMYVQNNYVIGNPNNFEVTQDSDSKPRDKVIICVGRFNDYVKRIDRILESFSLVLKQIPDAKLVLVGKYNNNEPIGPHSSTTVNDLINRLSIPPDSLSFLGEVDNVQDYYAKARVLLLTSNSEGFGMVLNEAACYGVPSVCNYIPGIEDIITDGVNGFITQQDDIDSMASRLCEVLTNDTLQKELSDNARKKASMFDSAHIGEKWKILLEGLIEIKEKDILQKKLNNTIGFKVVDQQLFLSVVSSELNEIFYQLLSETNNRKVGDRLLMLSKITKLPAKFKANIKHEGIVNTGKKVAIRSYRRVRNKLIKR